MNKYLCPVCRKYYASAEDASKSAPLDPRTGSFVVPCAGHSAMEKYQAWRYWYGLIEATQVV